MENCVKSFTINFVLGSFIRVQLKKSVVYCKKIHIRYKTKEISLHAIKRFFESTIEPKLDNMRKVTPDVVLLRNSLNNLKSNLMGILNKHNEIMLSHAEISYQQQQLENLVGFGSFDL